MKRTSFLFRRVVFCSLLVIRSLPALSIALFGFAITLAFGQSTGSPPNQLPPETKPVIPPGDDVIIYVHGGPGSRLEEASDLVKPLLEAGRNRGKGYTLISFDQPSQGYSSMVDPLRLVPGVLRKTQPPPDQVEIPFPISASQHNDFRDYVPGGAAHMDTAVGISKNGDGSGTLTAATHIWDTSDGVGFHGAVAVALLDGKNQLLWVSATQNRGVTCKVKFLCGTGKNFVPDQNFNWDPETVPAQVMQSFRHIAIMQRWNPRKLDDDIRAFLHNVGDFFAEVKPFLQNLPTAISHTVAGGNDSTIYYPLVAASDEFISGFLTELSRVTDLSNRNIYVMGGSTGGALTLGMGHSSDPRVKKIVAWNPASVWTSYIDDPNPVDRAAKSIALTTGFERSQTPTTLDQREAFFNGVFGEPVNGVVQPNPEEWYRGDRDKYPGNQGPFRGEWACKWDYISASRLEMEEVYNPAYDHWHWRLGTEVLAFSFFNDNWAGPAHDASGRPNANYMGITKPTLLVAGDDDDWAMGPGLHLENRWSQTRKMAAMMKNTPGKTLFLTNTGHSIHNERPNLFAQHIVDFLLSPVPGRGPLQVLAEVQPPEGQSDKDKDCAHMFSPPAQFPSIPPQLLENPASAGALMQLASRRGKINGFDPGRYSMRLNERLRAVAQRKDPKVALGAAAERFYNSDTVFGKAYADLAVTGRNVYEAFRKHQPTDEEVAAEAASILVPPGRLAPQPDRTRLLKAVHDAKTRAYEVAWALRNPDPQAGINSRKDPSLGWIAVSGEDDPPARPVNVPSGLPIYAADGKTQVSAYPQYEITVALCPNSSTPPYVPHYCPAGTQGSVPLQIRYTIASLSQRKPGGGPIITGVSLSRGPITGGTLVHVSLAHGSASNAGVTFGGAIPPQARCDGEDCWFTTPANAKPGPLNIVVAVERASAIVPRVSSKPSPFTYTPNAELAGFGHDSSSTDPASLGSFTPAKSQSLGLSATTGALVEQLDSNGPAAKAGVRVDDVIITLNGAPITEALDVRTASRHLAPAVQRNSTSCAKASPSRSP